MANSFCDLVAYMEYLGYMNNWHILYTTNRKGSNKMFTVPSTSSPYNTTQLIHFCKVLHFNKLCSDFTLCAGRI